MARSASLLLAGCLLLASAPWNPAVADVLAEGYELVVLGDPAAPATSDQDGPVDVTLSWRVREIFAGEPGSVSIAVRHRSLEPAQVAALGAGERWILLANADPDRPGRWLAPMPLRATPEALEAFRKWSAPPDVRPPRAVGEVVDEVRESEPPLVVPVPRPVASAPAPAAEPIEAAGAELPTEEVADRDEGPSVPAAEAAEGPILIEEEPESRVAEVSHEESVSPEATSAPTPEEPETSSPPSRVESASPVATASAAPGFSWLEPAPPLEGGAPREPVDRLERPVAVPVDRLERSTEPGPAHRVGSPEPVRVVASSAWIDSEPARPESSPREAVGPQAPPPLTFRPALEPPEGPGLPPAPPERPIGPPPAAREDLKRVERSAGDDA